jgi:ATP-dependent Zn protease
VLTERQQQVEQIVELLIDREQLDGDEIRAILNDAVK